MSTHPEYIDAGRQLTAGALLGRYGAEVGGYSVLVHNVNNWPIPMADVEVAVAAIGDWVMSRHGLTHPDIRVEARARFDEPGTWYYAWWAFPACFEGDEPEGNDTNYLDENGLFEVYSVWDECAPDCDYTDRAAPGTRR